MLLPRSPLRRRLACLRHGFRVARCGGPARRLWLGGVVVLAGAFAGAGMIGCQPPDTFLRKDDGQGGIPAQGGHAGLGGTPGLGGFVGLGGFSGQGGAPGLGGMTAAGGRTGSGGGMAAGGRAAGGTMGAGGAIDAGAADRRGAGGMVVGAGGSAGRDAGSDADGGMVGGTGPCAGICAPAVSFTLPPSFASPQLGLGAACYETVSAINGGGCSNCSGRTVTLNGTPEPISGGNWPSPIPARVNGGYCVSISAGDLAFATFYTF